MSTSSIRNVPRRGAPTDYGRVLVGLIVLALGTLLVLDAAGTLDAGTTIGDWWPLAIVAIGVFQLAEGRPSRSGPLVVLGAGIALTLLTTGAIGNGDEGYIWGALLAILGLMLLAGYRTQRTRPDVDEDVMRLDGIFGGPKVACRSRRFRGAALTAVFGGIELDLRAAIPVAEGADITATAVFGGIELIVPRGWHVVVSGTPIFGGIEDKTDPPIDISDDTPTLRVNAFSLFGGLEIHHEKKG